MTVHQVSRILNSYRYKCCMTPVFLTMGIFSSYPYYYSGLYLDFYSSFNLNRNHALHYRSRYSCADLLGYISGYSPTRAR